MKFNVFKRKKQEERPDARKTSAVEIEGNKKEIAETKKPAKPSGWSGGVLAAPHMTEKSSGLAGFRQFVFRVSVDANKIAIARAVEKKYGVNVIRVNTMNVRGKRVRIGKREGMSPGFKKAIVTLQEGQAIEIQ
jgi:large subunit ribosomal protein L23